MEIGHLPGQACPHSSRVPAVVRERDFAEEAKGLMVAMGEESLQEARESEPDVGISGEWLGRNDTLDNVSWRAGRTYDAWSPGHPAAASVMAQARQGLGMYAETAKLAQRRVSRGAQIDAFV